MGDSSSLHIFTPGQRWVSEAEPDLGLGLILEADNRTLKVAFFASDEERVYAQSTAPLSRVQFRTGETVRSGDGWDFKITDSEEADGLVVYYGTRIDTGEDVTVFETRLANDLRINKPQDRLFASHVDRNSSFELRYETLRQNAKLAQSPVMGLIGPRIDTIGHQLYIASEVAERPAPRVLLADEVGLGKTIEACLILHHQLMTERAQRALIVVPKALVSQWVLELSRRFNLHASILDEARCAGDVDEDAEGLMDDEDFYNSVLDANPFEQEQLVICTLDMLVDNPEYAQQAIDAGWDTLIVDEAHHLEWSEQNPSPEYQVIEQLSRHTQGLLLLTATPEQLGVESHFARLKLLDPDRFNSLDAFIKEEAQYSNATNAINALQQTGEVSDADYQAITNLYPEAPAQSELSNADERQRTINALIDRHGTGRVLFRNTRAHIQGFPERKVHHYALSSLEEKTQWLTEWLKSHKEKALVICAEKEVALQLEQDLHLKGGVLCAAFHEDLTLLARDRAAAWFAEDMGAQTLICSEIGSEGRNFQFAHHLVLFDLPNNPDLLEQRIGRLDRIGQTSTINIHIPVVENTAEHALFDWYHNGLNAFEITCPAARVIKDELQTELDTVCTTMPARDALNTLIDKTQSRLTELNTALEKGRDRLLELSSYNADKANELSEQLLAYNQYDELEFYLELMCDGFGIDQEHHSDHTHILNVGTHYRGGFKDISDDGTTVTLDRTTALSNDDFKFLTWEHPLIKDGFDQVLTSSLGNTAMGTLEGSQFEEGSLLVECLFVVHSVAPKSLQLSRYMPPQLFRIVIDNHMKYVSKNLPFSDVKGQVQKIKRTARKSILQSQKPTLNTMLKHAQAYAAKAQATVLKNAHAKLEAQLLPELERLRYLKTVNPSIRDEEIKALEAQYQGCLDGIENASIELDAVRVIITT